MGQNRILLRASAAFAFALLPACSELPLLPPAADGAADIVAVPDSVPPSVDVPDSGPPSVDAPDSGPSPVDVPDSGPPSVDVPDSGPPSVDVPDSGPPPVDVPDSGPPSVDVPDSGPPSVEFCDVVYAIGSGTCTAPAGRARFHNIKTGLGATNAYYDVGTNCSAPRRGSGGGTRVSSPFTPESFPRGFVRLRFPSAGGAPAAGAVQVIEYYLPLEVTVSILGTTVITDADHSAGLLRYSTTGCPAGVSGCLTGVSDSVAPTISRPCAPVAAGTVSGTSLTWASCRVSPPAPCIGTSCGPSNAQLNWAQANSQDTLSSAGCLTNISSWGGVFCGSGLCGFVPGTGAPSNLTWDQALPTMTFGSTAYGAAGTTLTLTEHIVPDAFNDVYSGVSVTAVAVHTECGVPSALTCNDQ